MRGWNRISVALVGLGLCTAAAALGAAASIGADEGSRSPAAGAATPGPRRSPAVAPVNADKPNAVALPVISATVHSSATGRPIRGARVEIYRVLDPEAARERRAAQDVAEAPIAAAATDASGSFSLGVPAGMSLAVVAEARGHARSRLGRPVTLTEDRHLGRFDLQPGRALTGKVVDAAGVPVSGATVVASAEQGRRRLGGGASFVRSMIGPGAISFPSFTRTASDGSFSFEALPMRPVSVRAFAHGLAPALVQDLRASSGVVVRLEPGHALAGRVVAPDGKTPVDRAWILAGDDGWDGATRSAADGSFRLDHLRSGSVSIEASLALAVITDSPSPIAGGKTNAAPALPASSTFAPSAATRLEIPLSPKAPPPVLRLRPGGIVVARVIDAETREPIGGTLLSLDAPGEALPRPATAGAKGEVIFPGVPVGRVEIAAEADGYLDEDLPRFSLAAGQTREISAALRPAASLEGTVRDKSGRPVSGASVVVSGPPPSGIRLPIQIFFPIGVDPVTTDTQGRFLLEPLPPRSELKVSVASTAFASWETAGIKLRPGERRKGMEILLDAGEAITGRLLNGDGVAVGGASITPSRRREEGPGGMVIRLDGPGGGGRGGGGPRGRGGPMAGDALPEVVSNTDGTFQVRGVTEGVWSLAVEAEGFAPKSVGGLKLGAGGDLDVGDVTLGPGAILRGTVMSASGEPVPFARCRVTKEFAVLGEFTTGGDGAFASRSLVPGEAVTLSVDADGFASVEKPGLTPPLDALTITLAPASRVSGTVVDKQTGKPVPDFSIAVGRSRGAGGGAMRMNMQIMGPEAPFHADDGAFTLDDIDPGKVSMAARATGYREAQAREVEVPEGKDVTGLTFALERAAHVAGTVTDGRGRPVPGATIEKKESSGGGMGVMIRAGGGGTRATSDGDGNFVLEGLERGAMTLAVSSAEYESTSVDVDTTRDVDNLRVTLSQGGSISGIVLHAEDGSAVDRATVSATAVGSDRFSGSRSTTAGPDGAFAIEALSAGRYTLHADAAGLTPADLDVVVDPGTQPAPVEMKLSGGVTLTGTITGVKEADLPNFTVRLVSGGFGKSAPVDASGSFEMKGLSPGNVSLLASSGILGGKSMTKSVEIPKGVAALEATIDFPRGNLVSGDVKRGGTPVAGASVVFRNTATGASTTATSDADGHYSAEDLETGDYDVNVLQFSSGLSHSSKTKVDSDKEFEIDIPVRRLTGRVVDAGTGKAIEDAQVSIRKSGDAGPTAGAGPRIIFSNGGKTDSSGSFAIEGLEDASYELTARKDRYVDGRRTALIIDGAEPGEVEFQLTPGKDLRFRVVDAAGGQPVTAISAMVVPQRGDDPLASGGYVSPTPLFEGGLSADASGLFHIDSVPDGTYDLALGGQGVGTEMIRGVRVPSSDPDGMSVRMDIGGAIEVKVNGLAPNQSARGVLLDSKGLVVRTNVIFPDPAFSVRQGKPLKMCGAREPYCVKPGSYTVKIAMPGGGVASKAVTVAASAEAKIAFP